MTGQVKKLRKIRESDLETLMRWRMRPDITVYMYTDPQLTMDSQRKWFQKVSKDQDSFYWIFEIDGKPLGLISLVDWDRGNNIIHTGGYIAEQEGRTLQNIVDVNMNLYAYAFEVLKVNKAAFEIMDNNMSQVQWMKRLGAFQEGISRQAIFKNGKYYDLYLLSFLRDEWEIAVQKNKFERFEIE